MAVNITIEQYRSVGNDGDERFDAPEGLISTQYFTTTGSNVSAAISKDCALIAVTADVASNITWNYTATPGQATTASPILLANVTRFWAIEGWKGGGAMTLGFRHS